MTPSLALRTALALVAATCAPACAIAAAPLASAAAQAESRQDIDLVMYTAPDCGYCERARQYFGARGIRWKEIDIASSAAAEREFKSRGGVGTPLIFLDGERITGFDAARLDSLLAEPAAK